MIVAKNNGDEGVIAETVTENEETQVVLPNLSSYRIYLNRM